MALTEGIQLALQGAATGIAPGVMVAQNAGHRQSQLSQSGGDAGLTIAQITHHQQRIWSEMFKQLLIAAIPLAMQITGNGDAELCQPDA
jgi:hypothetical protein